MPVLKWFRVAQSGPTVDGRVISPDHIDQMAASYDPKKYGARIFCEHFRSFMPESPFGAYGDVLALKAEAGSDGARSLLAQIDGTEGLMKLSAARQKIYFSVEIEPDFAGTGKAYLMGLGITDSPASLGTDMLKFSLSSDKAPAAIKNHLFSVAVEAKLEVEDEPDKSGLSFVEKFRGMLAGKSAGDAARFMAHEESLTEAAKEISALKVEVAKYADLKAAHDKLSSDFAALSAALEKMPKDGPRAPHAGGGSDTFVKTDC